MNKYSYYDFQSIQLFVMIVKFNLKNEKFKRYFNIFCEHEFFVRILENTQVDFINE